MDGNAVRELTQENHQGSSESLLPAYQMALEEISFLKDLEQRNLAYPFRSPEAEAELMEIRRELAGWSVLVA